MVNKKEQQKIIIYTAPNGDVDLKVQVRDETVWLDAHQMAEIFGVNRPAIVKHINNIYKTEELSTNRTCSILEQVATDGKKRKMNFYNLDMIISVGYRVNSKQATAFRIWATKTLKQHITKGYTINPHMITKNYETFLNAVEDVKNLCRIRPKRHEADYWLAFVNVKGVV